MSKNYSKYALKKMANEAGFILEEGYQRYHWGGFVTDCNGERTRGYQLRHIASGLTTLSSCTEIHDHALTYDEVVERLTA